MLVAAETAPVAVPRMSHVDTRAPAIYAATRDLAQARRPERGQHSAGAHGATNL
jgi:hypothetical protein